MSRPANHFQGSRGWFEMVGALLCQAIAQEGPAPELEWSLVERYSDGFELAPGLVQGIRLDISGGKARYRVGVARDETGDATVEVNSATARALNLLPKADPAFERIMAAALAADTLRIEGDLAPIAPALANTHDEIVARTV